MFRIEPSTTVQRGAYDVCNKEAVRQINDCYFKLYSDHTAGACNCRGNGLGNPARRWGSDVEKGQYALQFDQSGPDDNNDDGGGISNFSGISGSGRGSFSASAAAAAGFSAGGARGRLSRFGVDW